MSHGANPRGPLRILHILGALRPGGVENWLLRVMRSVDRRQYAMDFVVHTEEPCDYDPEIRRLGGRIFPCPHTSRPRTYARELRRIFRQNGPYDVVHSHVFLYGGYISALARLSGIPTRISHFHTPLEETSQDRSRAAYRACMTTLIRSCSTSILANSRSTLRSLGRVAVGIDEDNHIIYPVTRDVPPAATTAERRRIRTKYGLPQDVPVVLYLARFAPSKNHAQVVRIAEALRERSVHAHLVMAGSHGALLDHFREAAESRDNLALIDEFDDPMEILACADVFFLPSLKEGFGIVAHEAAASGLPVVATDLPSMRESVAPPCHDYLFPPDDDGAALINVSRLLDDETTRLRLGEASRAWAASMSPGESIRKLLAVYDHGIASPRASLTSRVMRDDRQADTPAEGPPLDAACAGARSRC